MSDLRLFGIDYSWRTRVRKSQLSSVENSTIQIFAESIDEAKELAEKSIKQNLNNKYSFTDEIDIVNKIDFDIKLFSIYQMTIRKGEVLIITDSYKLL